MKSPTPRTVVRTSSLLRDKFKAGHLGWGARFFFFSVLSLSLSGCTVAAVRPIQEMSNTTAALRAAKEVQADVLAPELYRQANEWYINANREYRLKNFKEAEEYGQKARKLAEQAEFIAVRNGGTRNLKIPSSPGSSSSGSQVPTPTAPTSNGPQGIYVESYPEPKPTNDLEESKPSSENEE